MHTHSESCGFFVFLYTAQPSSPKASIINSSMALAINIEEKDKTLKASKCGQLKSELQNERD